MQVRWAVAAVLRSCLTQWEAGCKRCSRVSAAAYFIRLEQPQAPAAATNAVKLQWFALAISTAAAATHHGLSADDIISYYTGLTCWDRTSAVCCACKR